VIARAVLAASLLALAPQAGNAPVDPFRIADNLYFVGSSDIGSYLITTPAGHILIDAGYESTAPLVEASIGKLGFKVEDVKFLLNTQGHGDHAGGFAALKKRTGAKLLVSAADADLIERGGARDFSLGDSLTFPAATVDRRLKDGDTVALGGTTLTAHLTPGHTIGCTTWTFDTKDRGRTLQVVDLCGLSILEKTRVSGMPGYPGITKDYEHTFETLKALPIDIFIGAHPSYYGGMEKAAKAKADPSGPNPFVDPQGFRKVVDAAERKFRDQLARERQQELGNANER
jgi:metallo-beta-lactamase class B